LKEKKQGGIIMKKRVTAAIGAAVICFALLGTVAYGFDHNQLHHLILTKQCPGCDLSKADISNANLKEANLKGANLNGANLNGTDLRSAFLNGANLSGVNLKAALIEKAYMNGANLSNATWTDGDKCLEGSIGTCLVKEKEKKKEKK